MSTQVQSRPQNQTRPTSLANFFTTPKLLEPLSRAGLNTLEDCAVYGTKNLLSHDGVGKGTVLRLQGECRKRGIQWLLCDFERKANMDSPAYFHWLTMLVRNRKK